jgi:uncharacterized damage-inducible protein DinB
MDGMTKLYTSPLYSTAVLSNFSSNECEWLQVLQTETEESSGPEQAETAKTEVYMVVEWKATEDSAVVHACSQLSSSMENNSEFTYLPMGVINDGMYTGNHTVFLNPCH